MHKSQVSLSFQARFILAFLLFLLMGCGSTRAVQNPRNTLGKGPAPITIPPSSGDLANTFSYAIIAKTGITNVTGSSITGNIGVSPAALTYITGFSPIADGTNVFSTSSSVIGGGKIYSASHAEPTPTKLTTAIGTMEAGYGDLASRNPPDFNELATGNLGGLTLVPGLYTWTTTVTIPADVTISGGANDVWIFQTTGDLVISAAKKVILAGGAQAKNIYWQVAGQVTTGATSHFEGIIFSKTGVTLQTNASMNGRVFAQTLVALDDNTVTQP